MSGQSIGWRWSIKDFMPSITVENYLKQLYLEQQNSAEELVQMGKLANAMGVVPGTATSMVKALADSGLVSYEPRFGAKLTKGGEQLALHVVRLPEVGMNQKVRIARIVDQDAKFLQFLNRAGLKPGVTVTVNGKDEHAD